MLEFFLVSVRCSCFLKMAHCAKLLKAQQKNQNFTADDFVVGQAYELVEVRLQRSQYPGSPDPLVINFKLNNLAKGFYYMSQSINDPEKVLAEADVQGLNEDIGNDTNRYIVHKGYLEGQAVINLHDAEAIKRLKNPIFKAVLTPVKGSLTKRHSSGSFEKNDRPKDEEDRKPKMQKSS